MGSAPGVAGAEAKRGRRSQAAGLDIEGVYSTCRFEVSNRARMAGSLGSVPCMPIVANWLSLDPHPPCPPCHRVVSRPHMPYKCPAAVASPPGGTLKGFPD